MLHHFEFHCTYRYLVSAFFCLFKPVEEAAKISAGGICAIKDRLTVYVFVINCRCFWYKDSRLIDYKSEAATYPYSVN